MPSVHIYGPSDEKLNNCVFSPTSITYFLFSHALWIICELELHVAVVPNSSCKGEAYQSIYIIVPDTSFNKKTLYMMRAEVLLLDIPQSTICSSCGFCGGAEGWACTTTINEPSVNCHVMPSPHQRTAAARAAMQINDLSSCWYVRESSFVPANGKTRGRETHCWCAILVTVPRANLPSTRPVLVRPRLPRRQHGRCHAC